MDVKSEVISEIDSLLSEYTDKKDNNHVGSNNEADFHALLGAIEALKGLKGRIENIDDTRYETLRIVRRIKRRFSVAQTPIQFFK